MADTLYGADLGSVATDAAGNVQDGRTFQCYSDAQGANLFTLTKAVASGFTVGSGTGGTVTATSIGRILFYAQDTDATLWLKNGSNMWAVNPVSPASVAQKRIDSALLGVDDATDALAVRVTQAEADINALQSPTATRASYQSWRARPSASKSINNAVWTSIGFGQIITSPTLFGVNANNDAVGVNLAGWYRVSARAGFSSNATGVRGLAVCVNSGNTVYSGPSLPTASLVEDTNATASGAVTTCAVSEDVYLTPADSLLVVVYQNSGSIISVTNLAGQTSLSLAYLGTA